MTELRASLVLGTGSASFELMRWIAEHAPAIPRTRWTTTRCRPAAVDDVLDVLTDVAGRPPPDRRVVNVGSEATPTYAQLLRIYLAVAGLPPRPSLPLPLVGPRMSGLVTGRASPMPAALVRRLIAGLATETVTSRATEWLPTSPNRRPHARPARRSVRHEA